MIIDAHQHFWHFDPVRDAWIDESMAAIQRDFLPQDLRPELEARGIDGCVAVQADQSLAQNDFLLGLARGHDFVRGVVGWVDLRSKEAAAQLNRYAANPAFVGVRHVVQAESAGFMLDRDFQAGVSLLRDHGLTYDILIHRGQLPEALLLARAFPEQPFVLDHLAKPVADGQLDPAWEDGIRALAECGNVSCKLSGLVTEAPGYCWDYEQLLPYVTTVLDAFGPRRLLYGSDWPVCRVAATYEAQLEVYRRALASLSEADRVLIFGGNAARFYGLDEGD
ncbi:amidohydrolase family protein [Lewinella sp. IMCC34183]|uniref:amidohydrolase family protein n=1 Tax=Lewinella sp. IMCC34183 TaxID=2248762 RepID=UPI000E255832|nr:amidohydrolase family protein [Lewinella sp. IMCC34183]